MLDSDRPYSAQSRVPYHPPITIDTVPTNLHTWTVTVPVTDDLPVLTNVLVHTDARDSHGALDYALAMVAEFGYTVDYERGLSVSPEKE